MTNEEGLKSCPFCGKFPKLFKHGFSMSGRNLYMIGCKRRGCLNPSTGYKSTRLNKEAAIKAWNTRKGPSNEVA